MIGRAILLTMLVAVAVGQPRRETVIGPDDDVAISALDAEEISKTWRVGPSGELNFPMIGRIQAGGLTVSQFEQEVAKRLGRFVRNPQVHVTVAASRSQPVTVMGAVGSPGVIQRQGRTTLLDAVVAAGGPKDAGPAVTVTRRQDYGPIPAAQAREAQDGKYYVADFELKDVLAAGSEASNLIIEPFDVISVSPAPKQEKLVHIMGGVMKPGAIELVRYDSVSIMQALAAAGGLSRTAAPQKTMIMHVNPEGVRTEIASVDLNRVMAGKVKDLELIAGDIVVVPSSQLKTYLELGVRSLVTSGAYILLRY